MSLYKLDKVFKPSSVAIIGASNRQGSIGHSLVKGIVNDDEDRRNFVDRMGSLGLQTDTAIYAWALMRNKPQGPGTSPDIIGLPCFHRFGPRDFRSIGFCHQRPLSEGLRTACRGTRRLAPPGRQRHRGKGLRS